MTVLTGSVEIAGLAPGRTRGAPVLAEPATMWLVTPPAARRGRGPALIGVTESTLLHGWHDAAATSTFLAALDSPLLHDVPAAVENAARSTDRTAPGTAALCGLARSILAGAPNLLAVRGDVAARAGRLALAPDAALPAPVLAVMHLVAALAGQAPAAPAVLAPLFLRPRRVQVGETVTLEPGVPVVLVTGKALLENASPADVVACTAHQTAAELHLFLTRLIG